MLPIFQRRISVKDSRFEIKEGQNLKIFEICDHHMAVIVAIFSTKNFSENSRYIHLSISDHQMAVIHCFWELQL